jgi:hypothetical protein
MVLLASPLRNVGVSHYSFLRGTNIAIIILC